MTRWLWPALAGAAVLAGLVLAAGAHCGAPAREETAREVVTSASHDAASVTTTVREVERTTTRTDERPGGRRVVTVVVERERAGTTAAAVEHGETRAELVERTTIVRTRASWRLGAAAGWDLARPALRPDLFEVNLARRVAGPVWLGASARTDGTVTLGVAVEW